jgi:hypothetical protein
VLGSHPKQKGSPAVHVIAGTTRARRVSHPSAAAAGGDRGIVSEGDATFQCKVSNLA